MPKDDTDKLFQSTMNHKLDRLLDRMKCNSTRFLGYPCNQNFDYSQLFEFLNYSINNVGDPFLPTSFGLNTHDIECEVINEFATLCQDTRKLTWGYVTNGGTEGNMYGFYLARELYPQGMVYYSEDTHYSVAKILRLLKSRSIMIKSQSNGEIDYDDLYETIKIHRDSPPIIIANIGTTMKGAVDDLQQINRILTELALPDHYIHADAALSGMILPFVDEPQPFGFDAGIDSISISGHKMIGSPIPCGIVLAKKANVERIARSIEYIGTLDTTLSGSRNGLSPLFLWSAINQIKRAGFIKIISHCLKVADYAISAFKKIGVSAWRNKNSNTVIFPRPSDELISQWQLAVHNDIAHIITMPHVEEAFIDTFISDYQRDTSNADSKKGVA